MSDKCLHYIQIDDMILFFTVELPNMMVLHLLFLWLTKKRPKSTTKHVRTSSHNRTFRGISKILQCGFIPKRVSLQTILSLREKRYIIHLDNYTIPKDNFFSQKINFNKTLLLDIFEFLRPNWKIFLNISAIKASKVFIFDVFDHFPGENAKFSIFCIWNSKYFVKLGSKIKFTII